MPNNFTPPSPEELNDLLPDYRIDSFLAKGGMGAVYLAKQLKLDREVAIKILPKEFGDNPTFRNAFKLEAKAMAKLSHPNLVRIFDFGSIDDTLYLVIEYVPGRTLFDKAHKRKVDMKEAAILIAEICRGLDHAHRSGLIHRDIKPANILIDDEARPKIVDFGLARPLDDTHDGGTVYGTKGYTAPEVLRDPHGIDQKADIFSAGVMLYELLTGQLVPYPYLSASKLSDSYEDFDVIILKAIHPQRELRYPHASEMAEELEALVEKIEAAESEHQKEQNQPSFLLVTALQPLQLASASSTIGIPLIALILTLLTTTFLWLVFAF
ncbi:serine/threonine-protein kinase [Rubritalea spongiae]|uniref:Serine/threonine-protein kinase n=1 Tax=Rubritalea spongiae TaxID=430797 RepID=A0ABW5DZK2_9BACT